MIKKTFAPVLLFCFLLSALGIYPANLQTTVKAVVSTYTVSGTQILKDGQPFLVKGINVSGPNSFWSESITNDASKIVDIWKFNTIRVVCRLTGGYANDSLTDIVNTFTAKGAVVMIEIHDFTGMYPDSTQQTTLNNWWVNVANQFKGNSAVWFNIMNEPGGSGAVDDTWRNSHESAIQAIRNTGAKNIIIVDEHGWAQAKGGTNSGVLRDGQYLKNAYGNIAFNIHTYQDWKRDNGQDLLNTYFDSTDAKGLCVFYGEYGVDTGYDSSHLYDCANTVTNTFEVAKARNIGRIGWHWFGGDKNDLTKSGNGNGNLIDKTDGARPTNLTFMGGMAWDDNHNITTGPAPNNGDKYEVEKGYISTRGVSTQTSLTGYSGTGYVGSFTSTLVPEWGNSTQYFAQVTMEVNASSAGSTPITFRYHNNSGSSKTLSVYINGRDKGQVTFSSNSSWADKVQNFDLRQGKNVITIWQDSSSDTGAVNLDYIKLGTAVTPPSGTTTVTPIAKGASWKYLDNGSNQGTSWKEVSYSDSSWAQGNAQLGYGDGDETTVVSYGSDSSNKHITTYFRKSIQITDASLYQGLQLNLLRDDGAVVYINGQEVFRSNMPSGTVSYTTLASLATDGTSEDTYYNATVNPSVLVNGTNVVAVEVHQSYSSSSDISFDLELIGEVAVSNNKIINGDFTNGTTSWYLDLNTATASLATSSGWGKVDITNGGDYGWRVRLSQDFGTLTSGTTYTISFDVKADASRTFDVVLEDKDDSSVPWSKYTRSAGTSSQTYTYTFTPSSNVDNMRICFRVGGSSTDIYFDNVAITW